MTTTVLITRHGASEHNLTTHLFMGRAPASRLVEAGREQARRLGRRLAREAPPARIVCSSLPRTVETAEIIAALTGDPPVAPEDDLWELSKGDWEGAMPNPPPAAEQARVAADPFGFRYRGGESYADVVARAAPVFDRHLAAPPAGALLFVLHGDVIRALLYHALRFPPERIGAFQTDPCALTEFRAGPEGLHLVRFNDACHLGPDAP